MAGPLEAAVAEHYGTAGVKERVLAGIAAAGLDLERLRAADLAPVDEFHTGGRAETEYVLSKLRIAPSDRVLDVGCGIGGASRYLAATTGCRVTGIDLTPEYVEIATLLAEKTGFGDHVEYRTASALNVPFDDAAFDAVITFHVAMNIKDRPKLYGEIARVLKPGGTLCVYDVMKGAGDGLSFPVPWAETGATSHLVAPDEMRALLTDAGFEVGEIEDRRPFAIDFYRKQASKPGGPPPLGLHLLTGANSEDKFRNYVQAVERGAVAPTVVIASRKH